MGYPPPTYQWYKDGEPIPGATLPYLYVPEATPEDRGSYTCVASNDQEVEVSSPGLVTIPGMFIQYKWYVYECVQCVYVSITCSY